MILVTGATGNRVARRAGAARGGRRPRVRTRRRAGARARSASGEIALGDFARPALAARRARRRRTVFLSGADDPRRVEWETAAIDAAAAAGVARLVSSRRSQRPRERRSRSGTGTGRRGAPAHLRRPDRGPALELFHVQPAGRRRAGGARGPVLRAGGDGADRDDRPARRRRRRRRDARRRPTSARLRPHRPRGHHATPRSPPSSAAATGREVKFVDVPDERREQAMIEAGLPRLRRRADRRDLRAGPAGRSRRRSRRR